MDLLLRRLQENGAEATRLPREEAKAFAQRLAEGLPGAAFGKTLPQDLRPPLPELPPEEAPLGVSWALFAVAETGSVALSSEDGRKAHLLPLPTWSSWRRTGSTAPSSGPSRTSKPCPGPWASTPAPPRAPTSAR